MKRILFPILAAAVACLCATGAMASAAHAGEAPEVFVLAHAGQLSPTDDCHNHQAAGERHWHEDGTSVRGGPCVKDANGETWHLGENALCADARIKRAVVRDMDWPTAADWEEVADDLLSCIQGLEPD